METTLDKYMKRFFNKVVKNVETGCWEWQDALTNDGYGTFWYHKIKTSSHKYIYEFLYGILEGGNVVDHICRNRSCVNPSHLERVSRSTNMLRGESYNALKTRCNRGHEFTVENTYLRKIYTGSIGRNCKQCRRNYDETRRSKGYH